MKIGILALQGAFLEHRRIFESIGLATCEVRLPGQLSDINGLVIPGGESTTMMKLMGDYNLVTAIRDLATAGTPIWGTCAGMVCLANQVHNPDSSAMQTLALMDITVRRNAFGRQVDSFEMPLHIKCFEGEAFPGVFIRAPFIEMASSSVEVLCRLDSGEIVAARQANLLATSFHPELTADTRLHNYFGSIVDRRHR